MRTDRTRAMTPCSAPTAPASPGSATGPRLSRRRFLAGAGAAGAAGLALPSLSPRLAFASPEAPATGDVLVAIFLRGGADGLPIVPPFSDTSGYQALRGAGTSNDVAVPPPNPADPANTAIDLGVTVSGHHFGLHPAATGLKQIWDAGHLAIVHAAGLPASESDTRSHFDAETFWERASADVGVDTEWIERHLVSSDPWLGIPVRWDQIAGARGLVEATLPHMSPEPSQGSHFFHNLSSFSVLYFTVSHARGPAIDWAWLASQTAVARTRRVRHVRTDRPLVLKVDGRTRRGVALRPEGT